MTYTKTCSYQSCREEFTKPQDMSIARWNMINRCPKCRKRAHRERHIDSKHIESKLGRYEVKSEIIDRFLYG